MAGLDEVVGRAHRLRDVVAEASTEVTSGDHAVTVVVGPGGAVRELSFSSRAFRYNGAQLGSVIVETIREANVQMSREIAETMAEVMGDRPGLVVDPFAPMSSADRLRERLDQENGEAP